MLHATRVVLLYVKRCAQHTRYAKDAVVLWQEREGGSLLVPSTRCRSRAQPRDEREPRPDKLLETLP